MIKAFHTLTLAALVTAGTAIAASAVTTLDVSGGSTLNWGTGAYQGDCSGGTTTCYDPTGTAGGLTENLQTFTSAASYPGLTIIGGPAQLTVTFLGKEASYTNAALSVNGTEVIHNTDPLLSSYSFTQSADTTVDFTFKSLDPTGHEAGSAGFSGRAAIAFSQVYGTGAGSYVYAYFDDSGANIDREFDDMVVKISIAAVPLPATGLLLLGGLAGFGALRRRKRA